MQITAVSKAIRLLRINNPDFIQAIFDAILINFDRLDETAKVYSIHRIAFLGYKDKVKEMLIQY